MWLFAGDEYLRFLGGRALETLVKQLTEMSLFVKHVAVNNISLFFSDATVDIAMPSPCTVSFHATSRSRHFGAIPEETKLGRTT